MRRLTFEGDVSSLESYYQVELLRRESEIEVKSCLSVCAVYCHFSRVLFAYFGYNVTYA